jgi:hypothetical protein
MQDESPEAQLWEGHPMERFVRSQNLALFRKKLSDPQLSDAEREVVKRLLAEEEAKEISPGPEEDQNRS